MELSPAGFGRERAVLAGCPGSRPPRAAPPEKWQVPGSHLNSRHMAPSSCGVLYRQDGPGSRVCGGWRLGRRSLGCGGWRVTHHPPPVVCERGCRALGTAPTGRAESACPALRPPSPQHRHQQRGLQGAHAAPEDPCGHLQRRPDGAEAEALPPALRVLRLRVQEEHELLRAEQHSGPQHGDRRSGPGERLPARAGARSLFAVRVPHWSRARTERRNAETPWSRHGGTAAVDGRVGPLCPHARRCAS